MERIPHISSRREQVHASRNCDRVRQYTRLPVDLKSMKFARGLDLGTGTRIDLDSEEQGTGKCTTSGTGFQEFPRGPRRRVSTSVDHLTRRARHT